MACLDTTLLVDLCRRQDLEIGDHVLDHAFFTGRVVASKSAHQKFGDVEARGC